MSRKNVNQAVVARIIRSYGIEASYVTPVSGGTENQSFFVEGAGVNWVLRIYCRPKTLVANIRRELDFMDYLRLKGFDVPEVVPNRATQLITEVKLGGHTWRAIMMTRMPGQHPTHVLSAQLAAMARKQARMHVVGAAYANGVAHRPHRNDQSTRAYTARWLSVMRSILGLGLAKGFSHFDFTAANLLFEGNRISAILDFDDLNYAPLVDCLAATITRTPELVSSRSARLQYLTKYQLIRRLSTLERVRLAYLTLSGRRAVHAAVSKLRKSPVGAWVSGNAPVTPN